MPSPKIVLVTGANSGIGYETVKALLESDQAYHVLVGARSEEKAQGAVDALRKEVAGSKSTIEALVADLNSDESIKSAFEKVDSSYGRVDSLINNAGATFDFNYLAGTMSLRDSFNKAYDVNVAGTQVMTYTFIPLLLKSSDPRLIFVSGLAAMTVAAENYFPTPPQPAGWPKQIAFETIGYRSSKVALNMIMLDWNHKLKEDGVKVWAVQPGMLATNLGNLPEAMRQMFVEKMGLGHPSIGGKLLTKFVEGEMDAYVGKVVDKDGVTPF